MTERDYENNPITPGEAITLFKNEDMELALASSDVIKEAVDRALYEGHFGTAGDITARWEDYQEELRCMMMEFN